MMTDTGNVTDTANLTKEIMIAASENGAALFRNNSGVCKYKSKNGKISIVRYGVGPDEGGGADLIGIVPVKITDDMVGQTLGIFVSVEVKQGRDRQSDSQKKWQSWIEMRGGFAGVARSVSDALRIMRCGDR